MDGASRRALLGGLGAAALGSLAGCASLLGGSSSGGERRETDATATSDGATAGTPSTGPRGTTRTGGPPMVRIAGGTYTIGTDGGPSDAQPAHEVTLAPFRIDRYEVTNARFAAFLDALDVDPVGDAAPVAVTVDDFPAGEGRRFVEGAEGEERRPLVALDDEHARIGLSDGAFVVAEGYGDHPVTEVTWRGARRYADWAGKRLPTEAEWEAAARGFEGRRYPWGDEPPSHERAVYGQASGETAPVGTHPEGATPDGVHDMAGNVSEWTSSLYRPYPYDADDGREDPTVRGERVTRGGAHVFFSPDELRTHYRTGFSREFDRGHRHIGFRCVRSVTPSTTSTEGTQGRLAPLD